MSVPSISQLQASIPLGIISPLRTTALSYHQVIQLNPKSPHSFIMSFANRRLSYQPHANYSSTSAGLSRSRSYHDTTKRTAHDPHLSGTVPYTYTQNPSSWPTEGHPYRYDTTIDALCNQICDRTFFRETPDLTMATENLFSAPSFSETPSLAEQSFDSDTSANLLSLVKTSAPYDFSAYRSSLMGQGSQNLGLGIYGLYKEDGSHFDGLGVLPNREHDAYEEIKQESIATSVERGTSGSMEWWGWSAGQRAIRDAVLRTEGRGKCASSTCTARTEASEFIRRHKRTESFAGDVTAQYCETKTTVRDKQAHIQTTGKPKKTVRLGKSTKITPVLPADDDVFYSGKSNGMSSGRGREM